MIIPNIWDSITQYNNQPRGVLSPAHLGQNKFIATPANSGPVESLRQESTWPPMLISGDSTERNKWTSKLRRCFKDKQLAASMFEKPRATKFGGPLVFPTSPDHSDCGLGFTSKPTWLEFRACYVRSAQDIAPGAVVNHERTMFKFCMPQKEVPKQGALLHSGFEIMFCNWICPKNRVMLTSTSISCTPWSWPSLASLLDFHTHIMVQYTRPSARHAQIEYEENHIPLYMIVTLISLVTAIYLSTIQLCSKQ